VDGLPVILVVGGDALTERVCAELRSTLGHEVRVVWPLSSESDDELLAAGVERASSLMALSSDDSLNLAIALRARMLNRRLRIVLRQFDPVLGTKIEQNLPDCTVLSPAAHSAATYAAAALDPGCFYALQFPSTDGLLLGFTQITASHLNVGDATVGETEERLRLRVLAIGDRLDPPAGAMIAPDDTLTVFGGVVERHQRPNRSAESSKPAAAARRLLPRPSDLVAFWHHLNPVARVLGITAVVFFSLSFGYFHFILHRTWTAAAFYVVETMTNVGFGDTSVTRSTLLTLGAITAMLGGIIFTSIFIGYVSSALTRAQWISLQGLRRIHARGHVILCGCGKIGMAVIGILTGCGKHVVVIDPDPDVGLVRRARERDVDLLTGSAHRDDALDLVDVPDATAVLALTNNDATNLEIALAARARSANVPLVLRMENDGFARATAAIFSLRTFSPGALTAPALAGLSRFPGTRGRVRYAQEDHTIGQRLQGETPQKPPAEICVPLCVWRRNQVHYIRDFAEMKPHDELLFVVPLGQFRNGGQRNEDRHARDEDRTRRGVPGAGTYP
jgi:Trk K+ transport system NAD-binding subunit